MAVTVTTVLAGANIHISDIESDADADVTTGDIPHGLGAEPLIPIITPLLIEAWTSTWIITVDAVNYVGTAANAVGAGGAGDQVRFIVMRFVTHTFPCSTNSKIFNFKIY